MKKTLLTALLTLSAALLCAQEITFSQGDKSNGKANLPSMIRIASALQQDQLLIVEPDLKAVTGPLINPVKAVSVRLCDTEWNDTKHISLPDTKGVVIQQAFRTGNSLHVILSLQDKRALRLRHIVLDAQSLDIVSDNLILDIPLQKGDETNIWTSTSPNGQYLGIVYALWSKNGSSAAAALLFDNNITKLWQQTLAYSEIFNLIVCDNGIIATSRLGTVDGNNDITAFRINIASATGEKHGEYILDADVSDLAILNTDGRNLLALALEGKGGYGILRIGTLGNRFYTGVWGLLFDLDEQKITVANRHPFTDDDARLFFNAADSPKSASHKVDHLLLLDQCTTPQGGAALYQRSWKEETRDRKTGMTVNEKVFSIGLLMVQADMSGKLTINHIPQCNQNADWPKVGADVFAYKDKVYVITNESKHEADEYTPDKPAQRSKSLLMANAALALYWFTPDGQGAKRMLATDGKYILYTPPCAYGDGQYYLLTGGISPKISRLTIK